MLQTTSVPSLGPLPSPTPTLSVLFFLPQSAVAGGVSNLSFGDLLGDLGATMYRFSFRIPPYYTLLVRSLTVLEGIALAADPGYKVRPQGGGGTTFLLRWQVYFFCGA